MTNAEIRKSVRELQDLEEMINELNAAATAIKADIKAELKGRELEMLDLGDMVIRNTKVLSNRLDTSALKKANIDLYNLFLKQIVSYKFSIA